MNSMTNWGLWHGDYGDPSALPRHLAVEEAPLVPLAGQHLSEAEWARLHKEGSRACREPASAWSGHASTRR